MSPLRDAAAVLTLVVLSNGPLFYIERNGFGLPGSWEGPVIRPMIIGTALLSVLLVVLDLRRRSGRRLLRPNRWVMTAGIGFGMWATLSVLWSVNPGLTLWRGAVYMALPFAAWILADLCHERFVRVAAIAFGSMVGASSALVVLGSDSGLDRGDNWKGVFTNRNSLAPVCAIAILLGLACVLNRRWRIGGLLVGVSLISLFGTGSRTAWIALLIALGGSTLLVVGRRLAADRPGPMVPVAAGITGIVGGLVVVLGVASKWNERTFVQRRTIWDLVGDHIAVHPVRGSGFFAFWSVPELIAEHELLKRGSAHGSVPEVLLGLGVIGLALWGVVVVAAVTGTLRWAWRSPSATSWFWLALTIFLLIENATESFVLWFSYNWVLLISVGIRAWHVCLSERVDKTARPSERVIS